MSADDPGELIGKVTGDVVTSFGRGQANGIEVFDGNVWSIWKGCRCDEAEGLDVGGGLVVVEHLVEVVDAGEELVGHSRRDDPVVDDGDILHVNGSFFVVGEKLRADGCDLVALSDKPMSAEGVPVRD